MVRQRSSYSINKKLPPFFTGDHIEVCQDGKYLFCHCFDYINIIEAELANVIQSIKTDEEEITGFSLSPGCKSIIIAVKSTLLLHYNVEDPSSPPTLIRKFKSYHNSPITSICWESSSTLLATGSADGTVRVWDIKQKFCTHSIKGNVGIIKNLTFYPNFRTKPWLIGTIDNFIMIWQLEQGSSNVVAKLDGHHSAVSTVIVAEDSNQLISCGLDKVIILWSLDSFESQKVIPTFESILSAAMIPNDKKLIGVVKKTTSSLVILLVGEKGIPSVWDVEKSRRLWTANEAVVVIPDHGGVFVIKEMKYVDSLNAAILTTFDQTIIFFDMKNMGISKQLTGFNDDILDSVFIGENDSHLVVATNSPQLKIYDSVNLSCQLAKGHTATVVSVARHPTKVDIFASCSHDNSARVWRLTDDGIKCIAEANGHTHNVTCLAFGKDFLMSGSVDTCLKKWDISKELLRTPSDTTPPCSLRSTVTEKAHNERISCVCVSINSKFVASASYDKTAKVWDGNSLSLNGTLRGHRKNIWCVQFSPVDQLLATSSADGSIKIWLLSDLSNAMTLEGHEVSVTKCCWISEGSQMVSVAADGIMKLWSMKNGSCVKTFDEHDAKLWSLACSRDGDVLVSGGEDGTLLWWKDVTEEERMETLEESKKAILRDQTLQNLIKNKKWSKALALSIRLRQPYRCLCVMKKLMDEDSSGGSGLKPVLSQLSINNLSTLLEFAIQWNTKTYNVREAQGVVNYLLKEYLADELESISNWKESLECLLPFTERHYRRVSVLSQTSNIIDYLIQSKLK